MHLREADFPPHSPKSTGNIGFSNDDVAASSSKSVTSPSWATVTERTPTRAQPMTTEGASSKEIVSRLTYDQKTNANTSKHSKFRKQRGKKGGNKVVHASPKPKQYQPRPVINKADEEEWTQVTSGTHGSKEQLHLGNKGVVEKSKAKAGTWKKTKANNVSNEPKAMTGAGKKTKPKSAKDYKARPGIEKKNKSNAAKNFKAKTGGGKKTKSSAAKESEAHASGDKKAKSSAPKDSKAKERGDQKAKETKAQVSGDQKADLSTAKEPKAKGDIAGVRKEHRIIDHTTSTPISYDILFNDDSSDDENDEIIIEAEKERKLSQESSNSKRKVNKKSNGIRGQVKNTWKDAQMPKKNSGSKKVPISDDYLCEFLPITRTNLRDNIPDKVPLSDMTTRDVILCYRDGSWYDFPHLTGVYSPVFDEDASTSRTTFIRNAETTARLQHLYENCDVKTRNQMSHLGINCDLHFEGDYENCPNVYDETVLTLEHNTLKWAIKHPFYCGEMVTKRRDNEWRFWNEVDSFFYFTSSAYSKWNFNLSVSLNEFDKGAISSDLAIIPADAYYHALQLAEKCDECQIHPKAHDFSFWNKALVVHAQAQQSSLPSVLYDCIGVFIPVPNMIIKGYPVWLLDRTQSNALAKSFVDLGADARNWLHSLGIDAKSSNSARSIVLVSNGTELHIMETSKSVVPILRGRPNPYEETLLTDHDALIKFGSDVFGEWKLYNQTIKLAISPKESFEFTLRRANLEASLLLDEVTSTPKKKKKKKKRNKLKHDSKVTESSSSNKISSQNDNREKSASSIDKSLIIESTPRAKQHQRKAKAPNRLKKENDIKCKAVTVKVSKALPSVDNTQDKIPVLGVNCERGNTIEEKIYHLTPRQCAMIRCKMLWKKLKLGTSIESFQAVDNNEDEEPLDKLISLFFGGSCQWLLCEEKLTSPIFDTIFGGANDGNLQQATTWLRTNINELLAQSNSNNRKQDILSLCDSGACIKASVFYEICSKLPKQRGDDYSNKIVIKFISGCSSIKVETKEELKSITSEIKTRIGKKNKKEFYDILSRGFKERESKKKQKSRKPQADKTQNSQLVTMKEKHVVKIGDEVNRHVKDSLEDKNNEIHCLDVRIETSIKWYKDLLKRYRKTERDEYDSSAVENSSDGRNTQGDNEKVTDQNSVSELCCSYANILSSEEVCREMEKCIALPKEKQVEFVSRIEESMNLFEWNDESEWTIDITEQAHKWFRKNRKRNFVLCERVIRRLKLLSTGRWPYVLCKRLKTKKTSINLNETKIDSGGRILWEVAISFSPRRSTADNSFCEQVIRVWDIVEDHDNLTRSIDRSIDRIEKSHVRGRECMIYSELGGPRHNLVDANEIGSANDIVVVPKVFSMRQNIKQAAESNKDIALAKSGRLHYPPASDDPSQFTLIKFYELNSGAIKLILGGSNESADLPFTPGPKEHDIIHHNTNPKRSILLMGRSGTGKTTCLVFRMWAQFMSYVEASEGAQPKQLFVTKNEILKEEVQKSFENMGLAWRRRQTMTDRSFQQNDHKKALKVDCSTEAGRRSFPLFLTSGEWLDVLDKLLPGESFFSALELEERSQCSKEYETSVELGIEAMFADKTNNINEMRESGRKMMTFTTFKRLWRKINSRVKSLFDPALVWLEIKSHIKGSVEALKLNIQERSSQDNRFLSLEEYLDLPRKQSRINESQRREVFDLYNSYEKLKREKHFYDEMDIVFQLAGRVLLFHENKASNDLLPYDALFVDEVQDFTQAELYLLTKLSNDPNNLMLAGDTAQSIAVGVGFRFTDLRQIFYNSFGGLDPELLQLTHNYRSHSGILRLAACVVELLYFFFGDSLDKLPPDLGLFPGPKPVIMEVTSTEDLVLMLDGSKRETSRIEFGAHQVVIVRNEKAKADLPDEFGVDKDWVMTVQESKGLEFDDVLLYNFFTNSDAGDLWRVISNYTERDIAEYYSDTLVSSSGVQRFEWDNLVENSARHLDFSPEKHKILEIEFKMLYTAITRARVNIFIAESDSNLCSPMFEYFLRRQVVTSVNESDQKDGMEGIHVFGKMNTHDEWSKRGEYYFENANGQRRKGCLRLSAKCFDKAGDTRRRDRTLAFLSYVDIEEQEASSLKGKVSGIEQKHRLYSIAAQLLECEDVVFLNKAALCLLHSGEIESSRCATLFELYADLTFKKQCDDQVEKVMSPVKKYYSYAAKLFEKSASLKNVKPIEKKILILGAFRNFLHCDDPINASKIIKSNSASLQSCFTELYSSWSQARQDVEQFKEVSVQICNMAKLACRVYNSGGDIKPFMVALKAISSTSDRIQVLSSLDESLDTFYHDVPWGSDPCFVNEGIREKREINLTNLLVRELICDGQTERAADVLQERGLFIRAADQLDKIASVNTKDRAVELRARYIDVILSLDSWSDYTTEIMKVIGQLELVPKDHSSYEVMVIKSLAIAQVEKTERHLWDALAVCEDSAIWKLACLSLAKENLGMDKLLDVMPGDDLWSRVQCLVKAMNDIKHIASVLLSANKPNIEEERQIAQVERYYDLEPYQFDKRSKLVTNMVTNLRLRQLLAKGEKNFPLSNSMSSSPFSVILDRKQMLSIIARHLWLEAFPILLELEDSLDRRNDNLQPCPSLQLGNNYVCQLSNKPIEVSAVEHHALLQSHILSLVQTIDHLKLSRKSVTLEVPSKNSYLIKDLHTKRKQILIKLIKYLLESKVHESIIQEDSTILKDNHKHHLAWRKSVIGLMAQYADNFWYDLSVQTKKESIFDAIKYWRILNFCDGKRDPTRVLEKRLLILEETHMKTDLDGHNREHIITKGKQKHFISKGWIWAIDCAKIDLFKSIASLNFLLLKTVSSSRLTRQKKRKQFGSQLDLLETSFVAIFSTILYRYSDSSAQNLSLFLPEKRYCNILLNGSDESSRCHGFGIPIEKLISATCENNFFECFEEGVKLIEFISDFVVTNMLLEPPSEKATPEEIGNFKRAILLSFLMCINVVAFSDLGSDMSPEDVKNEQNMFPKIPLQGKFRLLLQKTRLSMMKCKLLPHMSNLFGLCNDENCFADIISIIHGLSAHMGDKLVTCSFEQLIGSDVKFQISREYSHISDVLHEIDFHENASVFMQDNFNSQQFLQIVEETSFEKVEGRLSEESDKQAAAMVITRSIRKWLGRRSQENDMNKGMHWRHLKTTLETFVKIVRKRLRQKADEKNLLQAQGVTPILKLPLESIVDLWNPYSNYFFGTVQNWKDQVLSSGPFVDAVECAFCGDAFHVPIAQERRRWVHYQHLLYGRKAVFSFNCHHACYNIMPQHPSHQQQERHVYNASQFEIFSSELAQLACRLEIGLKTLNEMIRTCDAQKGSWYLNTGEDARSMFAQVDYTLKSWHSFISWPRRPDYLEWLSRAQNLTQITMDFFINKRQEEKSRKMESDQDLNGEDDDLEIKL